MHGPTYETWQRRLRAAVDELTTRDPLADGLSRGAARDLLALPDEALLDDVTRAAGLEQQGGVIRLPGAQHRLGPAEAAICELETKLQTEPFGAPEAYDCRR